MKRKILVVDNNPVIVKLMEHFLVKEGHEVVTAFNGLDALDMLNIFHPDFMFVDLVMPMINGRQFCEVVRAKPEFDLTVIVIITATAAEEEVIGFHEFGADYCIAKGPFKEVSQYILEVIDLPRYSANLQTEEFIYGIDKIYKREITNELLIANKHLELVLDHISDGVVEFTHERKVIYTNLAFGKLADTTAPHLLATDLLHLFDPADHILIQKKIMEANRTNEPSIMDLPILFGGKSVMLEFLPLTDQGQRCFISLAHDVTADLQRSEAEHRIENQVQLAHSSRLIAIGELAAGLVHEMRQPISIIDLACQYLKNLDNAAVAERMQTADTISFQAKRLSILIENMRTFSRPDSGDNELLEFSEIIDRGLIFFNEQFRLHQITILRQVPETLPKANINPHKFEQIVVNMLSNARYAVDARAEKETDAYEKRICISLSQSDDGIVFEMADNGTGMKDAIRRQCLNAFYTTKDANEGTGLGLSIAHSLVAEFDGRIEIESREMAGSTFRVTIPSKLLVIG